VTNLIPIEPVLGAQSSGEDFSALQRSQRLVLLVAAAVCSGCGLAIELLLGTLASYLVGNQALSYSLAVGGFLAAMGLGAYLSRFIAVSARVDAAACPDQIAQLGDLEPDGQFTSTSVLGRERQTGVLDPTTIALTLSNPQVFTPSDASDLRNLLVAFGAIELLTAPLCALLPLGLFGLFVADGPIWLGLGLVTLILGTLAGMEVPLLTRILERDQGVKDALSGVLALDYLGALVGSLAFPIVLLPWLGLFPSAAAIATLPAFTVFALGQVFRKARLLKGSVLRFWGRGGLVVGLALLGFIPLTVPLGDRLESALYSAPIIASVQSPYQKIVLTRQQKDVRLFLDGDLQFSTLDEYRYHESLVHPAIGAVSQRRKAAGVSENLRVLLLGAGDGMALREVLKWPQVQQVLLIDLDEAVVNLARRHPFLRRVNADAFADRRVKLQFADAFQAISTLDQKFDVMIADFPDPDRASLAKLYSQGFYRQLLTHLAADGVLVTQATSPFFAPQAFACIAATLKSLDLAVTPYTVNVPSFGPWGFVLASFKPVEVNQITLPVSTQFLTPELIDRLFTLPADLPQMKVEINRLVDPVLVRYLADSRWSFY